MPPAASVMLKQEELALLRAISSVQSKPVLLQELRKVLAAKKTAKAAACSKAKTSCVALFKRHATTTGARSVPPGLQPTTGHPGHYTPSARPTEHIRRAGTSLQPALSSNGR